MLLKGIIIGAIGWQTITTIVFIVISEKEEAGILTGGGVPLTIIYLSLQAFFKIREKYRLSRVRSILADGDTWYQCRPQIVDRLREENEWLDFPRWTAELKEKYPVALWQKYWMSGVGYGNFRYAPKSIWKDLPELK